MTINRPWEIDTPQALTDVKPALVTVNGHTVEIVIAKCAGAAVVKALAGMR